MLFGLGLLGGDESAASATTQRATQGLGAAPVALAMAASDEFDVSIPDLEAADIDVPPEVERAAQNIAATVKREAVETLAAETSMSEQEARETLADLDAEMLRDVAGALIDGQPERAQDIVATNTPLSEAQIESLITTVQKQAASRIDGLQQQLSSTAEAVSAYLASVLWAVFIACAAALAASIAGGVLGANSTREHHATSAA